MPRLVDTPFDQLYGLEVVTLSADEVRAEVAVRPEILQPAGSVHSGVYASMADAITSRATGETAVVTAHHTNVVHPITCGTIHATGRPRPRGRTTWVWEVDITDDDGRLCALVRMTVAIR